MEDCMAKLCDLINSYITLLCYAMLYICYAIKSLKNIAISYYYMEGSKPKWVNSKNYRGDWMIA